MVFTLGQTLVCARALDRWHYTAAVAALSVGFYMQPINQAVARANFHLIRRSVVAGRGEDGHAEAAAAFHVSQLITAAVGVLAPMLIVMTGDRAFYWPLVAFTVYSNMTYVWYFEIQTTLIAVDRPVAFEMVSMVRRVASFFALILLLVERNFAHFALFLLAQGVIAQAWVMRDVARRSDLFDIPRHIAWPKAREHLNLLWSSLMATFAEWISLSGPYAVFTIRYGVGPALIVLDTGMKLVRIVTTVVRNLSEIALPRVSRAVIDGRTKDVQRFVLAVLGLSSLPALVVAGALLFADQPIWRLLLAQNAVMPLGVGAPVAAALLACVGFLAGSHLVGHVGKLTDIRLFTAIAAVGSLTSGAYVLWASPSVLASMWAIAAGLSVAALAGLWATWRVLTR